MSDMTAGRAALRGERSFRDVYVSALLFGLAAYAVTGKGFAYAGIPPIFPAEVLLALGLATLVWPRPSAAVLCNGPLQIALAMVGWALYRTIPYVREDGVDALRDSVIVVYALFAFVTANLLLENPARISQAVHRAGRFFLFFGASAFVLYTLPKQIGAAMPTWPQSGTPLMLLRGGEVAVHLAGASVFALVGLRTFPRWWVPLLIVGIGVVSAQSRGGMLAILVPILLATALTGRVRPILMTLGIAIPLVTALYVSDVELSLQPDARTMRVGQLMDNATSIVSSGNGDLDGTKLWRIRWWNKIIDYTIHGDRFWTGKGFGVNLAVDDGFVVGDGNGPPLRSPHSAHMTILARTGVPGLALWVLVNASWILMMLRGTLQARLAGDHEWASLFIFLLCYLVAGLVNASFDVALEGPMMGVIFWVVFGAGAAVSMTYRALAKERRHGRGLPAGHVLRV